LFDGGKLNGMEGVSVSKTFTLKDLIVIVLKKFEFIMVCALASGILAGIVGIYYSSAASQHEVSQVDNGAKESIEYRLRILNQRRDALYEYAYNNKYIQRDPYLSGQVELQFVVDKEYWEDEKVLPYRSAYTVAYKNDEVYEEISRILGYKLDSKDIDSMIVATLINDSVNSLKVSSDDIQTSALIADYLLQYMEESLNKALGSHTVRQISRSSRITTDSALLTSISFVDTQIEEIDTLINEQETVLQNFVLHTPKQSVLSITVIFVKLFFVGLVLGAIVVVLIIMLKTLFDEKISTEDDIRKYYQLPTLGCLTGIREKRHLYLMSPIIKNFEGYAPVHKSREESIEYITSAVALRASSLKEGTLLLCGVADEKDVQLLVEHIAPRMEISVSVACSPLYDEHALTQLRDAQYVILVESRKMCAFAQLSQEVSLLKELEKPIIGVILT
jgi:capsular polysaccharide biosynthesis protein